jgi:hypothetical protein
MKMAIGDLEKVATGWHVPLSGATVSQITIDNALGLLLWAHPQLSVSLKIESPFKYSEHSKTEIIQWKSPRELGRFASLFDAVALSADITTEGDLDLRFADGRRIEIAPDPNYEAFDFMCGWTADGGWKIICLPGGGLAEWLPSS